MSDQVFCDWLTVSEVHSDSGRSCPERFTVDASTGELLPRGLEPFQIEGLCDSSVRIWSDGSLVRFSGNPSRWNRSEAVFGVSVDEAKARVNAILADHGFPPFSDKAEVSRVDLTRNFALGSKLAEFQRLLQSVRYGRLSMSTDGGNTYWGAHSRLRQLRAYAKGPELRTHLAAHKGEERAYLARFSDWLIGQGALRIELELGRDLSRFCVRRWSQLEQRRLCELFSKEVAFMSKVKRLDLGELEGLPVRLLGTLMVHLSGVDVKAKLSRSEFYRQRSALLPYGYDIGQPVTKRFVPKAVYIDLEPLEVPDFAVSRLAESQLKLRSVS